MDAWLLFFLCAFFLGHDSSFPSFAARNRDVSTARVQRWKQTWWQVRGIPKSDWGLFSPFLSHLILVRIWNFLPSKSSQTPGSDEQGMKKTRRHVCEFLYISVLYGVYIFASYDQYCLTYCRSVCTGTNVVNPPFCCFMLFFLHLYSNWSTTAEANDVFNTDLCWQYGKVQPETTRSLTGNVL